MLSINFEAYEECFTVLQIVDNIYSIQGLMVGRVYVIVGTDGLTLIDSSLPGSLPKIESELAKLGKRLTDVKRHLITHAHPDHIGSTGALQKATNATVYVHHLDKPVVEGAPIPAPPLEKLTGINRFMQQQMAKSPPKLDSAVVNREINDGDVLDEVYPGLTVVATPGHSAGHSSFYIPSHRLMFTGDLVMNLFSLRLPLAMATPDMDEAKRSIKKVAAMDLNILCFGHGLPIMQDGSGKLRQFVAQRGI